MRVWNNDIHYCGYNNPFKCEVCTLEENTNIRITNEKLNTIVDYSGLANNYAG